MSNIIVIHGKVTTPAKLILANINHQETAVAKFVMVDVGEVYQKNCEPTFFRVNYAKPQAALIDKYLTEGKEILVTGKIQERFRKNNSGERLEVYYVIAESVQLLPVYNNLKKKEII